MASSLTDLTSKIVIVGGGVAGLRTAEALRHRGFPGTLVGFGTEPMPPYERPQLSKVALRDEAWSVQPLLSSAPAFTWFLELTAVGLDLPSKQIELDNGQRVDFDGLVIATGRRATLLPHAPQAMRLRTLADTHRLRSVLFARTGHLVIVGGGLIGTEVASAARTLGWAVTIVDATNHPLAETLGTTPASWLWDQHRDHGVHLHFGVPVTAVHPTNGRQRVALANGSTLDADAVITAVGTTPNTSWLAASELDTTDGVRTNDRQQVLTNTGDVVDAVVAVGDVARNPSRVTDGKHHWATAANDARHAAAALLGFPQPTHTPPAFSTELYTHELHVIGQPHGTESTLEEGPTGFCVRYHDKGKLAGAVAVDWPDKRSDLQNELSQEASTQA
jgi:3-phenylpropionate/trans-cinnamate dioxygenase ferredoxin reductase component